MILVAGVGNIFQGDDAFGSELARHMHRKMWPEDVRIVDFGIRGLDLMYALLEGYDAVILIDAAPRGEPPGTLYVIEPELTELESSGLETHGMDPMRVLAAARQMGAESRPVYVLGCEPGFLEGMGLSPPVRGAMDEAAAMVENLLNRIRTDKEAYEPGKIH
jgi:hydrogenase maturation protease